MPPADNDTKSSQGPPESSKTDVHGATEAGMQESVSSTEDTQDATSPDQKPPIPAHNIQALLQQLALSQPKREGKAPQDYKFWNTQPVLKFQGPDTPQTSKTSEEEVRKDGAILPDDLCRASIKLEPEKLVDGFEWCLIDLNNSDELKEFHDLLFNHYVEDTDGSFRLNYSTAFLVWALKPPGWKKEWHIGVRTNSTTAGKKGKLVASITGVPATLRVRQNTLKAVEINFLAIHRKLRNKRLAPVLIKEITRRCYQNGIYQALYTAGAVLPTPISTCRYFHRSLDWGHLYQTGFTYLPSGTTELRQKYKYKLESQTTIPGIRPMRKGDLLGVKKLLTRYNERFHLYPEFSDEELAHYICSDTSKGVVSSYVVERDGQVTDFVSYYLLDTTVIRSKTETIRAAYLYYYATDAAFSSSPVPENESRATLQARLQLLIHNTLILAKKEDIHVFNALTLLDNPLFLKDQKFEPGDGKLHYYLFNWRTPLINGGIDQLNQADTDKMGGVGVVML